MSAQRSTRGARSLDGLGEASHGVGLGGLDIKERPASGGDGPPVGKWARVDALSRRERHR